MPASLQRNTRPISRTLGMPDQATPPALLGQAFLDRALKFESKQGVEKEMTQVRGAAGGFFHTGNPCFSG